MEPIVTITLRNYRCFAEHHPATIQIYPGATAFVGVNNAGKSVILRFFYELRDLFESLGNSAQAWATCLNDPLGRQIQFRGDITSTALPHMGNKGDISVEVSVPPYQGDVKAVPAATRVLLTIQRGSVFCKGVAYSQSGPIAAAQLHHAWFEHRMTLASEATHAPAVDLTGLARAFEFIGRAFYVPAFRGVVSGIAGQHFDALLGTSFVQEWRTLQTGTSSEHNELAESICETVRSLLGFRSLSVHAAEAGNTLKLLIDGKSHRLDDVGSGVAHLIQLITHIAKNRPGLVLIDEPEVGFHPSLQVEALSALTSFGQQSILFATHQYGLAASFADRTFSIIRENGYSRIQRLEATPNLAELMGAMSYRLGREIGINRVLLVEGPTEIRIVSHFLRQLNKQRTYILLPLGGASGINGNAAEQLNELKRICPDIRALVDSERTSPAGTPARNVIAFDEVCQSLGVPCHILNRRAMENYFPDAAIKRVLGPAFSAIDPFTKLCDHSKPWHKSENWRIAAETAFSEIEDTDLGRFFAQLPSSNE